MQRSAALLILMISIFLCLDCTESTTSDSQNSTTAAWPRFRGPDGTGMSPETRLLRTWPESGPTELWRQPIGTAYAGMSIDAEQLFTMESDTASEYLLCLDAATGRQIWRIPVGPLFRNSYGDGPRMTPTIDGDRVYALGAEGNLVAANRHTGEVIWNLDLQERFAFRKPEYWWGFSSSPVVEGDLLLVQAAGEGKNTLAGIRKLDGEVIWSSYEDVAAYSTPSVINFAGKRQFVFVTGNSVVSLAPATGEVYWTYPWGGSFIKVAMPVAVPPDKIFVSASYGIGAVLLRIGEEGDSLFVEEVWKSGVMENHFHTSILRGGYLYGFDNGTFKCIEAETGKEMWARRRLGKGSLILAGDLLIVLSDRGRLVLAEANPEEHVELSSFQALTGRSWTPPSLANGRLYLRNQNEIVAFDMVSAGPN